MFSKKNSKNIPLESTSHASGSRKMIVNKTETSSKYFEACTYGFLPPGVKWEMHEHTNIIEICIVTKGSGFIRNESGEIEQFTAGDRFIFPANTKHEIENNSDHEDEFYFIRIQDQ